MVGVFRIVKKKENGTTYQYVKSMSDIEDPENVIIISSDHFRNFEIPKLDGIEKCVNLEELYLYEGLIQTEKLSGLTKLRKLYIDSNSIYELDGLEQLVELRELDVSNNCLTSIDNIKNLVKLEKLNISYNEISDISCLSEMLDMKELSVTSNKLTNLKGIQKLEKLEKLCVKNNNINSFGEIVNCPNIKVFTHD